MEIRTKRGKLVGVLDEENRIFCIKDRSKETVIEVPQNGLRISFTPGDGAVEEVFIPPLNSVHKVA